MKFVNFNGRLIPLLLNVCKLTFHIPHVRATQKIKVVLMRNLQHYFHMKTKILADFQVCVSVPLKTYYKRAQRVQNLPNR